MQNKPKMELYTKGSCNEAVNVYVREFCDAQRVLSHCTGNYTVSYSQLSPGVALFASRQFSRMCSAADGLDLLGFQDVKNELGIFCSEAARYINETMAEWNKLMEQDTALTKMWTELNPKETSN